MKRVSSKSQSEGAYFPLEDDRSMIMADDEGRIRTSEECSEYAVVHGESTERRHQLTTLD